MGRKVKTPSEAIAEVTDEFRSAASDIAQLETPISAQTSTPFTSNNASQETGIGDIFKFDRLERDADGWSLIGLELPDGNWSKITLLDFRMTDDGHLTIPERLIAHSEGKLNCNDISSEPSSVPRLRIEHIAPTKALYWFMRAALTDKTSTWPELIDFFRKEAACAIGGESIEYASSRMCNGNEYWKSATVNTAGWPIGHPLNVSKQVDFNLNLNSYLVSTHTPPSPLVTAILGDHNMTRVNEVYKRVFGFDQQLCFDVPSVAWDNVISYTGFRIRGQTGQGQKYHTICANHPPWEHATAFLLRASDYHFIPRVKP